MTPVPGRHRSARYGWLAVPLCLAFLGTAAQDPPPSREYQVKAVFLFNFAQFVEWPDSAFGAADAPLIIGVLGDDPFGAFLDTTVQGESVNRHPLVVRRFRRVDDIGACHILFVSRNGPDYAAQAVERLKDRAILTVSETATFARSGGMVQFVTDRNRIRLLINLQAAQAADLTLSSKLLRPAEIIATGPN